MKDLTADIVFARMEKAISNISVVADTLDWKNPVLYANWLAQSYLYVRWTTRQLALASSRTKPGEEDHLHWRFIEEAKEEKKHEVLVEIDIKNLGYKISDFPELPHTSFFYQTLTYMIERENPISILGYALTLEGYAATKGSAVYDKIRALHGEKNTGFLKLHCEVDQDHFANALPYLKSCPVDLLPYVLKGIELCEAIYIGILRDVADSSK
jgi:hypothetical protein